jgi:hypothetical protein
MRFPWVRDLAVARLGYRKNGAGILDGGRVTVSRWFYGGFFSDGRHRFPASYGRASILQLHSAMRIAK